ncbi:MAG: hypothetical protein WD646_14460 [Actinomycetota bacterium]
MKLSVTREEVAAARREVWRGFARYRAAGISLVVLLAIILAFPPARSASTRAGDTSSGPVGPAPADIAAPRATDSATSGGSSAGADDGEGGSGSGERPLPANCDPNTGRIKFPSVYAPPCVYPVVENGGATYQGVTGGEIKIVLYRAQPDPTVDSLIRAAGAADTREDIMATYRVWLDMFQNNFETYGRRVTLQTIDGSGPTDDDAAARADAIKVATQIKPFAVFGGPPPFVDELARRGIVCITQAQRPKEYFEERAPFVYGTQMSSSQVFLQLAEYIGKRLWKKNAIHAGDAEFRSQKRKFGLIYSDTPEGIYRPGVAYFEKELARYGAKLTDKVSYEGDINRAQELARVVVSRLKEKGITSVLFSGDPVAPIFFTQEATNQGWFPEWVLSGGTLVDTNFFGRTYDQRQWSRAFGMSQLWIRPPQEVNEPHYQHVWHTGSPPRAKATYEILYQEPLVLFTAIHMAGPNLNPRTFRDGLFSYPVSGKGLITQLQRSFGRQGVWPFDDYTGFDTVTEVWWDPSSRGNDEVGNAGAGQFQFVDGGKRYAPGEWPTSDPKVFTRNGARTSYDSLPPSDVYPKYPKPK